MLEKLCCPFDKAELDATIIAIDLNENIQEGYLYCSKCNRIYPIVLGIPIMNPDEYREFQYEQPLYERWNRHLQGKNVEQFRLTVGNTEKK